jgi:spore coat protein U-like protein
MKAPLAGRTPALLAAIFLAVAPGAALAGTATSPMAVSAIVANACTVTAGAMAFGGYALTTGTPTTTTATITTLCTISAVGTITMDAGLNAGGPTVFASRAMKLGAATLAYQVYTDSGHTLIWGDGVNGGSHSVQVTGTGANILTTAYGSIPAAQTVAAGTYSDTVTVTISF